VPIYATGMGAELVFGTLDNTQIYSILAGHGG
jgi:alkaline phosphatase